MSTEIPLTLRASLVDGRQATLADGRRKVIVRIYDEPPTGFRAATIQTTTLAAGTQTSLHLEGRDYAVCIVAKRQEGRRLILVLERLDVAAEPHGESLEAG